MSLFMFGNIFTQNTWVGGGFYSQFLGHRTAMKNIEGCLKEGTSCFSVTVIVIVTDCHSHNDISNVYLLVLSKATG